MLDENKHIDLSIGLNDKQVEERIQKGIYEYTGNKHHKVL